MGYSPMLKRILITFVLLTTAALAKFPRPLAPVSINMGGTKKMQLTAYKGKVVLFAIIATSCGHCIDSLEILKRAQASFGPQGFQVVVAIGDPNAPYLLQPFTQRYKLAFPVGYLDQDGIQRIADEPDGKRPFVPIYLFLDRKGTVRFQFEGNEPFFKDEEKTTRIIIENLLK
jgi:thiol-disulfide isomerase/thioredoxin